MRRSPLRRSLPSFPSLPSPPAASRGRWRAGRTVGAQHLRRENENEAHPARVAGRQTTLSLLTPKMELLWAKRKEANSVPETGRPVHGALKRPEATRDNPEARPHFKACYEVDEIARRSRGAANGPRQGQCAQLRKIDNFLPSGPDD